MVPDRPILLLGLSYVKNYFTSFEIVQMSCHFNDHFRDLKDLKLTCNLLMEACDLTWT